MLDNNDLKQIGKIMDSRFEKLAIIFNKGFKNIHKRFDAQDKKFAEMKKIRLPR